MDHVGIDAADDPRKPPGCREVGFRPRSDRDELEPLRGALAKLAGKQVMVGCLDLNDPTVETPETVAARIRRALPYVAAADVILAPDCGMKYLPREVAFGKLRAMVEAARILRAEHGAAV